MSAGASRTPVAVPAPPGASGAGWRQRNMWAAVVVLLVVGGVVFSLFVGSRVARGEAARSLVAFDLSSAQVASTLQLAIEQQNDLLVNAGAYIAGNPTGSQSELTGWANSVQLLTRYPQVHSLVVIAYVPLADLPAFTAQVTAPGETAAGTEFQVVPPGSRPFYCLATGGLSRETRTRPLGVDFCADPGGNALLAARDSGVGSYEPITAEGITGLGIESPIYSGGTVPGTVELRRAAFLGWVGILSDPSMLMDRALQGNPGMAVSMRYHLDGSDVTFSAGHAPLGARSRVADLATGWTVSTAGATVSSSVFDVPGALQLMIAGLTLSVLLGAFVWVLGTGRQRARRLVEKRTGQLRHQALHDALTGLPNRVLLGDRLTQLLARARRDGTAAAVLFLDLDDFKNVNDTLGHQAGDRLLIAVAARLASTLREVDTIARMGGDEFVVLIDGASVHASPELVAQRLLDVMGQPFDLGAPLLPLTVNLSIGIATGDKASADELLRDADTALYQAKGAGKNRYATFDPQMQSVLSRHTELEFDLRSALTEHQYHLVYQPIYNLTDLSMVAVEALLRWDHPTMGVLMPEEFIPILEQSGQIHDVGRWVLQEACAQAATWRSRGDDLDISVNVSARQLDQDSLIDDIAQALQTSGLPADALIIEVTETALMHNVDDTAQRLRAVKTLGVRIAVDDFGTGYSSLAYLRKFPVDSLKIDRMFTNAITTSPESKALIGTLVQLGKDLGLSTLAEGVETVDEMDVLRAANVDQGQGFLMAHPLDPTTLENQLLIPTRASTPTPPLPGGHPAR